MYPGCGVGGGATSRTFINRDVFGQNYNSMLKLENFIEIKQTSLSRYRLCCVFIHNSSLRDC